MGTYLSSKVLSNHCAEYVSRASLHRLERCLPSEHILSLLIGFRLYAIAEDPIWSFSNGSSISFVAARCLMSPPILWHVAPNDDMARITSASTFREYVCDVMGYVYSKPASCVTSLSSSSTLSWSPPNMARNEAWVPVVPLTPRKPRSARARVRLRRSQRRSWIQRQARLPTVVSWAG